MMEKGARAGGWALLATVLVTARLVGGDGPPRKAQKDGDGIKPCRRIVVSIPDRKLALLEDGVVVKVYSAAVGATNSPTPPGTYRITVRVTNPTYYKSGQVVLPGAANPVGTRWLGLSLKGYGIHGTNRPKSIGKAASHGCIRLRNRDIEELYDLVRPGDVVELRVRKDRELAEIFSIGPAAVSTSPIADADSGAEINERR